MAHPLYDSPNLSQTHQTSHRFTQLLTDSPRFSPNLSQIPPASHIDTPNLLQTNNIYLEQIFVQLGQG
jgi:hypothetical protein